MARNVKIPDPAIRGRKGIMSAAKKPNWEKKFPPEAQKQCFGNKTGVLLPLGHPSRVIFLKYDRTTTGMKDQIQQLIAAGQTKDALQLLVQINGDALLLQAQYNNGEKQFNLGLIDFGEWQRIQARVNFAALEMAGRGNASSTTATVPQPTAANSGSAAHKVFISYNHNDSFAMRAVKAYLEDHNIKVFVDIQDMGVGDNISAFIDRAFQENQFILSIISQNSLKSGWVNKELSATFLLSKFGKKWIPVLLDNAGFDIGFYNNTMDAFEEKIKTIDIEIKTAIDKGRGLQAFTDERERIIAHKNDFDKTIQNLKNHLAQDISGQLFEFGMGKVVNTIKG